MNVSRLNSDAYPLGVVAGISLLLTLTYLEVEAQLDQTALPLLNQVGPIVIIMTCLWGAWTLFSSSPLAIWTPAVWFLLTTAAYYGFGPLSYPFGTPETVDYMDSDFRVDDRSLLRTNLLNSLSIGIVCCVIAIATVVFPQSERVEVARDRDRTRQMMWIFLILGGTVKYMFTLPYYLGLLPWVLPGSIQHIAGLISSGIILMMVLIHRGATQYRWILVGVVISEFVSGLMTFSKTEVIMTVLAVLFGRYLYRPNLRVLFGSILLLGAFYALVLSPFVLFARIAFSGTGVENLDELQDTVETYNKGGKELLATLNPNVQTWWTRLCYSSIQAFTMEAYDEGVNGETFNLLPYVFVPRLFFPDKPIMTPGRELTRLLTGDETLGHTGLGVFGEAYWNGGWLAVVLACTYLGLLYFLYGRFSMATVSGERYQYFPIVFFGVWLGLRPDDWFVSSFVGSLLEVGLWYVGLTFAIAWLQYLSYVSHKMCNRLPQGQGTMG